MYRLLLSIALSLFLFSCHHNTTELREIKPLPDYPSASGIEFYDGKLYVIGDDAKNILVLDSNLALTDSIPLYAYAQKKIPRAIKPDLEAMTVIPRKRILLLGSGSVSPYRNMGWILDPATQKTDSIRLDTFYQRLQVNDVKDLNIEGACLIPGQMLLSNRGNKTHPRNHLIFAHPFFWTNPLSSPLSVVRIGVQYDSSLFQGVSGLAYSVKSDQLILTVSTEDTKSSYEDGTIGKSYLWIVKSISSKKRWAAINPNRIIDLEETDPRFKGQKIESVCILKETRHFLHLVLAADNDNGSSTLFKMIVEKD